MGSTYFPDDTRFDEYFNLKLFINGQQEDTADYTTSFIASGNISIGADLNNDDRADGLYNEIFCLDHCRYNKYL